MSAHWCMLQVEAGNREVAGVEAGDGRDESNRSLAERLADAQNAQVLSALRTDTVYSLAKGGGG